MPFTILIKRYGSDAEKLLQARDVTELTNQLRLELGLDVALDPKLVTYQEHETKDYQDIDKRLFRLDSEGEDFVENKNQYHAPARILQLKKLLIDNIYLSAEDEPILKVDVEYYQKNPRQPAPPKALPSGDEAAVVPAGLLSKLSKSQIIRYQEILASKPDQLKPNQAIPKSDQDISRPKQIEILRQWYLLKQWRENKGEVGKQMQEDLLEIYKDQALANGSAGYATLYEEYNQYRYHKVDKTEITVDGDEPKENALEAIRQRGLKITIHGDEPEEKVLKGIKQLGRKHRFSLSKAFDSIGDSFFDWKNWLNPFSGLTLTILALAIQAFIGGFFPATLVAASPVLTGIALMGLAATLLLTLVAVGRIIKDINDRKPQLDAVSKRSYALQRPDLSETGVEKYIDDSKSGIDYSLEIAHQYLRGLWNNVIFWKKAHPNQATAVQLSVAAFVFLTLVTSMFLGGVPGFDFMEPIVNFLTGVFTPGLGMSSLLSGTALAGLFLIAGPIALAQMAKGLGQVAYKAQVAGYGLGPDSLAKQEDRRAIAFEKIEIVPEKKEDPINHNMPKYPSIPLFKDSSTQFTPVDSTLNTPERKPAPSTLNTPETSLVETPLTPLNTPQATPGKSPPKKPVAPIPMQSLDEGSGEKIEGDTSGFFQNTVGS